MNLLFIARRFPPSVGGMERFAYDLSNALEKNNSLHKITWGGSNKWLPIILPWFFVRAFFILLSNPKIELIHMQDAVQAPIGWLLSVIFRKPFIVVAHGLDITYEKAFYQQLILPFVRKANKVISISSATQDEVLKRGIKPERAVVITLGTHDDYPDGPSGDKVKLSEELGIDLSEKKLLLTTGRLVKRKGVAWFIQNVLPELVRHHEEVVYLVAGDGAQRENIEAAVRAAKMEDHVRLLGRVSDEARSALYQSSDVFVMPNIVVPGDMEGFGIVVHEAATAKLPVVASNLEGIKDALANGKNGVLVTTKDVQAFDAEITKFLDDDEYSKQFGERARDYTLTEYGWDSIAAAYTNVYDELAADNKSK